jgi:hypothetical protein
MEEPSMNSHEAEGDLQDLVSSPIVTSKSKITKETYRNKETELSNLLQTSYFDMDQLFQKYLNIFVDNAESDASVKKNLKIAFFIIVMIVLLVLVAMPFVVLLVVILNKIPISYSQFAIAVLSSTVEIITSLIVLPKIIAEYLFNKDEDKNKTDIIARMQKYNKNKRDRMQ